MAVADANKTAVVTPGQRRRSIAIAVGLGALAVIFFAVTMVRLGGNVAKRMEMEGKASRSITLPAGQETSVGQ